MRKLDMQKRISIFEEDAKKAAKDVCGNGLCCCSFNCGHTNKSGFMLPNIGENTTCPLEKYNIVPDTRTFAEKLKAGDKILSPEKQIEQMFAICACCEYVDVVENGEYFEIERSEQVYHAYCLDCPVQKTTEAIEENMAEAMMS